MVIVMIHSPSIMVFMAVFVIVFKGPERATNGPADSKFIVWVRWVNDIPVTAKKPFADININGSII
jgi:hypothetical protein